MLCVVYSSGSQKAPPFVAPQKITHDKNILKLTILLTKIRLYQKQMHLYNAGTTILCVALCL